MQTVIDALRSALGPKAIVSGDELTQRATSYWNPEPTQAAALVRPANTEELSMAMAICHAHEQAVVTQGGLTGCVSGCEASSSELIISLERMTEIERIDPQGSVATVQAGVVLETLQNTAAEKGLLFPLDLGARGSCTIGGNIATNAGGINVLRYGMMRDLVLGLEVVTADGTVLSSMNQMLKNNAGYDLKQLFIGSEGTLGIVTRAVLRLFPRHTSRHAALVAMDDFGNVIKLLHQLQRDLAGSLSAYEVMWGDHFRGVTGEGGHRAPLSRDYPFYVVLEMEGSNPEADGQRLERLLEQAFVDGSVIDAVIPKSESERREIWEIRENFEAILPAHLYDVSLPISKMEKYVEQVMAGVRERWENGECFVLGHIADGNLHFFLKPGIDGDLHGACDELVYGPLEDLGGSVSAEHGIGTEKLAWLGQSRSPEEINTMRALKRALDPQNLLNPGRVLKPMQA